MWVLRDRKGKTFYFSEEFQSLAFLYPQYPQNPATELGQRFAPAFFRRPAHRFFISSDNRFLPDAVSPPDFCGTVAWARLGVWFAAPFEESPSRALMAPSILFLSAFNSETITVIFTLAPSWIGS